MSFVEVKSFQYQGLDKKEIFVQGIKTRGLGQLTLSGNLAASLRDSRDKIKAVAAHFGTWGPVDKILLNLLPTDISKFSPLLELPMLLATQVLLWEEPLNEAQLNRLKSFSYMGSISLSGELLDAELLNLSGDKKITTFKNFGEIWSFVLRGDLPNSELLPKNQYYSTPTPYAEEREFEKFWISLASQARVPVLLVGPPGIGKTHLARWALSLLPKPDSKLRADIDRIWALAGQEIFPEIPYQNPHSRAHLSEFVGVARNDIPRPGVFSLAHGGLLVLDEFPELARDCREILRNILDEKKVSRNTKAGFSSWPADFWLIMTANPCPCGFARGRDLSKCRCPEASRQKYLARFSGPLLDRVGVKLFLSEEKKCLPTNLIPQKSQNKKDFSELHEQLRTVHKLTSRESEIFGRLWQAFESKFEANTEAVNVFLEFINSQKNFSSDWFVHVYG